MEQGGGPGSEVKEVKALSSPRRTRANLLQLLIYLLNLYNHKSICLHVYQTIKVYAYMCIYIDR